MRILSLPGTSVCKTCGVFVPSRTPLVSSTQLDLYTVAFAEVVNRVALTSRKALQRFQFAPVSHDSFCFLQQWPGGWSTKYLLKFLLRMSHTMGWW